MKFVCMIVDKVCLLAVSMLCLSCASTSPPVMDIYPASGTFAEVKENLEMAILDEGLQVSGTLALNKMLTRTGTDLGYPNPVYHEAESLEFCSAVLAHRMAAADPRNLASCPFTVMVFSKAQAPQQVYLAFRRPQLAGAAAEVEQAMLTLLERIVQTALDE